MTASYNYNPASSVAAEFICDREVRETIEYAMANRTNSALAMEILSDPDIMTKGLRHRQAALILMQEDPQVWKKVFDLAIEIKRRYYGNRIVMFAPLYLSNYCINGCTYCPYHSQNRDIPRRKLSQEEIAAEVTALQDMGHKRLALETGEHPLLNTIDYVLESIRTIYSIKHKNGAIRRVNVNIAATTVENYRRLHEAGIGTYILFQETYDKARYEAVHPRGPKSDYAYHTEAMDRAMEGGIDDVGIGVLFGLSDYRYDFVGLLMHAEHLVARFGVGPHTISLPRICDAEDIDSKSFENGIPDSLFEKLTALLRVSVPYTGMIISTRESPAMRERLLRIGVSQLSGGSRTTVGGYAEEDTGALTHEEETHTAQFDVSDNRTLDEVVRWLLELGYLPSFCTACYKSGRTGDRFMSLLKSGQIANCCAPNAIMTLREYLLDYASEATVKAAEPVLRQELDKIPNPTVRVKCLEMLDRIAAGERDFRF